MERARKTKYLTYIEDTPKYHYLIKEIAMRSGKKAITKSKLNDIAVTFLEGKRIIRKNSNGTIRVIKEIETAQRKVKVGSKISIQKR